MGSNPNQTFKRKLIARSVAAVMIGASLPAAVFAEEATEEVIVTGIKAAQESAVNTKRDAASVVDAISAEDIGKLPDATISDSLQRIPGIQIRRSAGEGGNVNVRGLPQVTTQLNGESYLGAGSITTVQPNFGDIPSQLFSGADVIKSPEGKTVNAGLSGTINLKTRRPFDLEDGFTAAGAAEVAYGTESKEADPSANALFGFKGENAGVLVAVTKSTSNLANLYEGKLYGPNSGNSQLSREGDPQVAPWNMGKRTYDAVYDGRAKVTDADIIRFQGNGGFGLVQTRDAKDDDGSFKVLQGDASAERFYAPEGYSAFNKFTERDRDGFNASFQADLGEGFELVSDYFYTSQDEWNRSAGVVAETKWDSFGIFTPTQTGDKFGDVVSYQTFNYTPRRVQSYSENEQYFSKSQNFNLQLNYDNGGAFTGSVRYAVGNASQHKLHSYFQADAADAGPSNLGHWTDSTLGVRVADPKDANGNVASKWQITNPNGYKGIAQLTLDHSGDPSWTGWDQPLINNLREKQALNNGKSLRSYLEDPKSYSVAAVSSENNYDRLGSLDVIRADGSYKFEDSFITSVDFGVRQSEREAENSVWQGVSTFYADRYSQTKVGNVVTRETGVTKTGVKNESGCEARWKATDIHFGNDDCSVGERNLVNGQMVFTPWTAIGYKPLTDYETMQVTDYANVSGIPGVWTIDPKAMDDVVGFHTDFYGNYSKSPDPGQDYKVSLEDLTGYIQGNFEYEALKGNLGLRVVTTELTVKQNLTGGGRSYGLSNSDVGDREEKSYFKDVLPALNLSYDVTDELKLRGAYSKNMALLDLDEWGRSVSVNYVGNTGAVTGANFAGNPKLKPWRSSTMEVSAEYYLGAGSLVSLGYFTLDIDSFPQVKDFREPFPDADGVIRNPLVAVSKKVQGDGGDLNGIEAGAKVSLSDLGLEGIVSNFGFDTNITLTDSENKNVTKFDGSHPALQDNSELQYNLVLWYQDDKLQARIAYNYRDERVAGDTVDIGGGKSLVAYQAATGYVDAGISYDVIEDVTVSLNASNITGEYETYYLETEDQYLGQNYYEPRYTLGVRAKF